MRRLLPVVLLALSVLLAPAAAHAQVGTKEGIEAAAEALREEPVYVHPDASDQMSAAEADALAERIKDANRPVFVAVLPDTEEFRTRTVLQDLRAQVGIAGVYAAQIGEDFGAAADPRVMSNNAVANLRGSVVRANPGDAPAQLSSFVGLATEQAAGRAPRAWGGAGNAGIGSSGAITLGLLILAVVLGSYLLSRRTKQRKAAQEREELERLRVVVDEDITAFGEELARINFDPSAASASNEMRTDYAQALDCYETAKSRMAAARRPSDVGPVTQSVAEGRFALATLEARQAGAPLPEHRPPCFFDPRHGPSTGDVQWAPPGAAPRMVPACAADAAVVARGEQPESRIVQTSRGPQPYWNAGPAYAPWAGGYFGGGMLPGLLMGTMLGSMMYSPGAWAGSGDMGSGGAEGGDFTGGDFNSDDFSGGFGGFGGGGDVGGGGDFGGGF